MRMRGWGFKSIALAAVSTLCVMAPIAAGVASAAGSAPPWEPDANAAAPYGNVVFYDANGNQITSGTNLDSPFAYAVALTAADSGATKAIVNFYNPQHGVVPGNWSGTSETGVTTFSPTSSLPAGTPADVAADAPVFPVAATSTADIGTWLAANVPDTTAGYANTIQVRLTDSGPFGAGNPSGTYWETDIGYNTTASAITVDGTTVPAHGWAQLFPLITATSTTLTATPTSPQPSGTQVTLKATVSPAKAGTVQFLDGTADLGSPVTVSGGTASLATTPAAGSHSFSAVFVPTRGDETGANTATATIIGGSTSNVVPYTITSAGVTVTGISPSPLGQGASKVSVTVTGTGFATGAKVTITGVTTSSIKVVTATTLTAKATVSATAATGPTNVTVKDAAGSGTCTGCLTIDAGPKPTSLSPSQLAVGAHGNFTVTGTGFQTGAALKFTPTGVKISKVKVVSATSITVTLNAREGRARDLRGRGHQPRPRDEHVRIVLDGDRGPDADDDHPVVRLTGGIGVGNHHRHRVRDRPQAEGPERGHLLQHQGGQLDEHHRDDEGLVNRRRREQPASDRDQPGRRRLRGGNGRRPHHHVTRRGPWTPGRCRHASHVTGADTRQGPLLTRHDPVHSPISEADGVSSSSHPRRDP